MKMEIGRSIGLNLLLVLLAFIQQASTNPVTSLSSDLVELSECRTTPLHEAVRNGSIEDVFQAAENGTDLYTLDCKGRSAMHLAIELDKPQMIDALIDVDFDVNYQFTKGESVMFFAIRHGNITNVERLISYGTNVNMVTSEGSTPLLEALMTDQHEIIELLKSHGASYYSKFQDGDTSLHRAAESGKVRLVLILLQLNFTIDEPNDKKETPLTKAAMHNHPAVMNILIARGANKDVVDTAGKTLIYKTVLSSALASLRVLLENNVDPNSVNRNRIYTPLYAAMLTNSREAAELLVMFRADLNRTYEDNYKNLLHVAAKLDRADSIPWLVELGLNVNSTASNLWTPLHYAANNNKIDAAKVLVSLNACLTCKDSSGYIPRDCATTEEMRKVLNPNRT